MGVIKNIYRFFTNWRWEVGFLDNTLEGVVNGEPLRVHWVNLPFRDRWFADPFILDYNEDEIILLCEEYSDEIKKGRIAKVVINRKTYELESWKIVHELPTHLSFPRIIREGEDIYIHPENSASGNHTLYKYDRINDCLVDGSIICDDPLTDPIMLEHSGKQLLFSTYEPEPNGNTLTVYEKKNEKYVRVDRFRFDSNCARMAGDFFKVGDKLYRPAQDCNRGYGKAVILQEVHCDENGNWSFVDVRRITSPHPVLQWGMHTLNHFKELTVIDVKGPRYSKIAKVIHGIKVLAGKVVHY